MSEAQTKRGHHQGSIRKKAVVDERKNVYKWELRVTIRDEKSAKVQRSHTFTGTESAAKKRLAEMRVDGERKGIADGRITVGDVLKVWLKHQQDHVSEGAIRRYRGTAERHVEPRWGNIKLRDVTRASVKAWYDNLRGSEKGRLGHSSIRMIHTVMAGMLAYAVNDLEVLPSSPLEGFQLRKPRAEKNRATAATKTLDWEQAASFYRAAIADRGGAPLAFCLLTGCRIGEALALKWGAVDLEAGTVRIKATRSGGEKGGVYENGTKSGKERVLPVAGQTLALLQSQMARQEQERAANLPGWTDTDYVFFSLVGKPYRPDAPKRYMARICKAAGLERFNPHRLRHTAASLLISEGKNIVAVSEHLGHSGPGITLRTYSHALPEDRKGLTLDF